MLGWQGFVGSFDGVVGFGGVYFWYVVDDFVGGWVVYFDGLVVVGIYLGVIDVGLLMEQFGIFELYDLFFLRNVVSSGFILIILCVWLFGLVVIGKCCLLVI